MNRSVLLATLVVAGTVAWVLSGQIGFGDPSAKPQGQANAATEAGTPPVKAAVVERVRVARLTAQPMHKEVILQGRTEAARSVDLRAEVRGPVEAVLAAKGVRVRQGQPILRLAVEDRRAQLDQSKALLAQRKIELDAAETLYRRGNGTEVAAATARAQYDSAQASLRRAELDFAKTEIKAPFDGVLNARPADVGDYLDTGATVATIVDLDPLKVVGFATERDVRHIRAGDKGFATIVGGREIEGRVAFVAAAAEATTRTFRVELDVPNPDQSLIAGLTAQARLPLGEIPAHFVSPSSLSLDDDGTIGIKTVDAESRVVFLPVTILTTTADGAWIAGAPEEIRLITVGHEFVKAGNKVEAVETTGSPS